jgi:cytochrome c oxidase subunit 4
MTGHLVSRTTYFLVFAALLALLGVTVWASHLPLPRSVALGAALGIATLKALLIVLYFMHVKYASGRVWLFASAGIFWLMLLMGVVDDFATRGWVGPGGR